MTDPASTPAPSGSRSGLARRLVNVAVLVAVLWANALAGSGALSGESIGVIANRYPSPFLPAGWVFGIWSLIYLALVVFALHQAWSSPDAHPASSRLGWGWAVNGALNVGWVVTFSFSLFVPALVVMVALLVNLVWIDGRIGWGRRDLSLRDRLFVAWPFGLYLAWISVALIANTFQTLTYLEWGGLGMSAELWAIGMMTVATGLSAFMLVVRGNVMFPLVFAWAFVGIADRAGDGTSVATAAYAMTGVCLGILATGLLLRRRMSASP